MYGGIGGRTLSHTRVAELPLRRTLAVPMRPFFVLLCVLVLALPAGATEPSGGDGTTPLAQLTAAGESEIAFYEAAASLGTIDAPSSGPADPA